MSKASVFAIGDLHLPGMSKNKSMDVFGTAWEHHFDKIRYDWQNKVGVNDIVIVAGDISWAMKLSEAMDDLYSIADLPGRKVLIRGNHDFWWGSVSRLRNLNLKDTYFIQNDSLELDEFIFAGSRGWNVVSDLNSLDTSKLNSNDKKIYERELTRLKLSLEGFNKSSKIRIGILHYPPLFINKQETGFTTLFSEYGAKEVVYGHLHGLSTKLGYNGNFNGVNYTLVSADAIDFKIKKII